GRFDEARDHLARRGILDVDRLAAARIDPLAVDVELRLPSERLLHRVRILPLRAVDCGHLVHLGLLSRANLFLHRLAKRRAAAYAAAFLTSVTIARATVVFQSDRMRSVSGLAPEAAAARSAGSRTPAPRR